MKEEEIIAEQFVDTVLNILTVNSSPNIKEIRRKIELCFKALPQYAYNPNAQRKALQELLLSIINEKELNEEQKHLLDLHFVEKRFLRPLQEYFLKYLLMDLIYGIYDFIPDREAIKPFIVYIDKVANYLNDH